MKRMALSGVPRELAKRPKARAGWDSVVDAGYLKRLLRSELEVEAEMRRAGPWTDEWWRGLRRLNDLRNDVLRTRARMVEDGA